MHHLQTNALTLYVIIQWTKKKGRREDRMVVACQIGSLTMSWMKWEEGLKPLLRISSYGELSIILVNKVDDEWATMHGNNVAWLGSLHSLVFTYIMHLLSPGSYLQTVNAFKSVGSLQLDWKDEYYALWRFTYATVSFHRHYYAFQNIISLTHNANKLYYF